MQMPGRHGFATETGTWHGSYAFSIPPYLFVDHRGGNTPLEYVASQTIELSNGFLTGAGSDNYVAYIADSTSMAALDSAYQLVGGGYRYGFNGKEKDDDIYGDGNAYNFGDRIQDPRIGRWLSIDPLFNKFPNHSPYSFGINNPITIIDFDGRDIIGFIKEMTNKNNGYQNASMMWTKSETFMKTLGRFSNINSKTDDSKILGFNKSGDLSKVNIGFNVVNDPDAGFVGFTRIQVKAEGKWLDLQDYSGSLKGLTKKDFKVQVTYNNASTNFGEKLLSGNHEIIVHAEEAGELINKLGIDYDAKALQNEYVELVNNNTQHREALNGRNANYEKANDEMEASIKSDPKYSKGVMGDAVNKDIRSDYGTKGTGGNEEAANRAGRHTPLQSFQTERKFEKSVFNKKAENVYETPKGHK